MKFTLTLTLSLTHTRSHTHWHMHGYTHIHTLTHSHPTHSHAHIHNLSLTHTHTFFQTRPLNCTCEKYIHGLVQGLCCWMSLWNGYSRKRRAKQPDILFQFSAILPIHVGVVLVLANIWSSHTQSGVNQYMWLCQHSLCSIYFII